MEPQETAKVNPLVLADSQAVAWSRTVSSWLFIRHDDPDGRTRCVAIRAADHARRVHCGRVDADPVLRSGVAGRGILCIPGERLYWRGLRVTSLLFAIPLKRIAPEQIAQVEAPVPEPTQWGGWGYRIMPGRSAIILRKGPGMVITQRNEKQFAVSLDQPEEPASILLGLYRTIGAERRSAVMTAQSELVVPKLTTPGKVRVITVGAILPLLFAMSGWAIRFLHWTGYRRTPLPLVGNRR